MRDYTLEKWNECHYLEKIFHTVATSWTNRHADEKEIKAVCSGQDGRRFLEWITFFKAERQRMLQVL